MITVRLPIKPLPHIIGEILHRGTVTVLVAFGNNIPVGFTSYFTVRTADLVIPENELVTAFGPWFARLFGKRLLECLELAVVVQILLEFRNIRCSAVVPTGFVEHADECIQQRRHAAFIGFLIDVEQDRCGRNGQSTLQLASKHGIVLLVRLGDERTDDGFPAQRLRLRLAVNQPTRHITQNMREHLEQVGLTGTEEARNPRPILRMVRRIVVLLKERLEVLLDLPGQHVLVDFLSQILLIIGFDDAIDLLVNVPGEQIRECHLRLLRFHIKTLLVCCGVLVEVCYTAVLTRNPSGRSSP